MKKLLFLTLILFLQQFTIAQNMDWVTGIEMDPYQNYGGIQNEITDAIIDDNGAIWSAFKGNGGNLYKGYVTSYYSAHYTYYCADSLNFPATDVRDLCIENGVIYAATDSGVVKFDGTDWTVFLNTNNGLHSDFTFGIEIKDNIIYARTDTVVNIYDINAGTFSYVYLPNSNHTIWSFETKVGILIDNNNNLYVGDEDVIYLINNDTISTTYSISNAPAGFLISDIKKTNSGQLYAVSNSYFLYKLIGNELVDMQEYLNPVYQGLNFISTTKNILVDYDTIYVSGDNLVKITDQDDYQIYYFPYIDWPDPYLGHFEGVLFRDENNKICIKNDYDHYNIFDLSLYTNLTAKTQDNFKYLDINNVNAGFKQNGVMFWDKGTARYEVPKGSGKHSNFTTNLWITAEDAYSLIYCSAGTYNINGFDYLPGPLNNNGETDSTISYQYNKVWKINRMDIEEMRYRYENGLITQPGYEIPKDIITWPANGDVSQGYSQNIADYYDANSDNVYNVYDGDYPIIHGDQEIFSLFNDNIGNHEETNGVPLKLEIHNSFYAYSCPNATDSLDEINYTTFLHYKIINKSDKTYLNTRFGMYSDADIGDATDDLVGSNVDLKSFYFYNYGADGDGTLYTYGENPPALSYTFLKGPIADENDWKDNDNDGEIDETGETCDFNYFLYFPNPGGPITGDTSVAIDFYYYMQSKWKDGSNQKYDTTNINANFAYPGSSDSNFFGTSGVNPGFDWYNTAQGDKRGIGSMGPFTFEPGDTAEFTVALVWSRDTTDTVDYNNVQKLFRDIANVSYWYENEINLSCIELDTSSIYVSNVKSNVSFNLYPNPVKDYFNIEYSDYTDARFKIIDLNGRLVFNGEITTEKTIVNTKHLPKGVYVITIYSKGATISKKFVK